MAYTLQAPHDYKINESKIIIMQIAARLKNLAIIVHEKKNPVSRLTVEMQHIVIKCLFT